MLAKTFAGVTSACRLVLVGLILLGLVSGAAMATAITKVDVTSKSDCVIISVAGDGALKMTPLSSSRGDYVGFQFGCRMTAPGRLVGVHSGRIHNVRYSNYQANPPSTRIVVNTAGHLKYSTEWAKDKKQVAITVWKHGANPEAKPNDAVAPKTEAVKPVPVPVAVKPEVREEVKVPVAAAVTRIPQGSDPGDEIEPQLKSEPKPVVMARLAPAAAEQPRAELERKVSLNFLGADINDVLKALSVQSGYNIVSSKDVTGNVTVSLSDVTVNEAMDYVAKLSGYSYAKEKNTYLVGGRDSLSSLSSAGPSKRGVAVVALNYAKSDDVMAMLKAQYPELNIAKSGGDSEDANNSGKQVNQMIVLNGPEDKLEQVKQLVSEIDDSVKGLVGEDITQIYKIKHVRAQELMSALINLVPDAMINLAPSDGFNLTAPGAVKAGNSDSASGSTVEQSNTAIDKDEVGYVQALIISGPGNAVKRAMDLAQQLDFKSPQIKIEAKITSLTESGGKKLGLSWEWSKGNWEESVELISLPPEDGDGNPIEGFKPLIKPTLDFFRQPLTFGATLEALITQGEGELLAAPTLLCIEGKPGLFFVGDEVRYIIRVETTPTGQNVLTEQANVGVQLRVNADVSPDGYITMNLHPEVSMLKLAYDTDAKVNLPIISRRFTDHVVRVKNGDTIAIGGLIRSDEVHDMSKIPILGDLPLIGKLFRHKTTATNKTEVVLFLTASVIED